VIIELPESLRWRATAGRRDGRGAGEMVGAATSPKKYSLHKAPDANALVNCFFHHHVCLVQATAATSRGLTPLT